MMSMEMMEKMEQIGELLDELQSDEMRQLQQQMRSAMDQLTPQQIADAIREVSSNQEEYLEKLDRSIKLLEQMRREQQLESAASRTEELLREQQELSDLTENAEGDSEEQSELADQVDELREYLEELAASLEEEDANNADQNEMAGTPKEMLQEAIADALEQMKKQNPAESMRDAAESMSDVGEQAGDKQHQAMRELAALYHVIREAQQTMQMQMEQSVITGLRRLAHELLELSRQQELLIKDIPNHLYDADAVEMARRQQRIMRSTERVRNRMREILDNSSMITGRLLRDLDGIVSILESHVRTLQDGNSGQARHGARNGLARFNLVVINLLTSIESPGSGQGGGAPMPSAGEQLERMAQDQAGLNGLTEMMAQQMSGQRSDAERLDDGQLGEQQRQLAEELLDLDSRNKENSERLLGDLQEIARDAEQVAREISSGDISEETLRRQERILGRMLDARNSARQRDFSTRRESRSAADLFQEQTGSDGILGDDDSQNAFQRRQFQADSIPAEYRDLVRRYFEYLRRLENTVVEDRP